MSEPVLLRVHVGWRDASSSYSRQRWSPCLVEAASYVVMAESLRRMIGIREGVPPDLVGIMKVELVAVGDDS